MPLVVIEMPDADRASPHARMLVDTCSSAVAEGRCTLAEGADENDVTAVAIVRWEGSEQRSVSVTVGLRRTNRAQWLARQGACLDLTSDPNHCGACDGAACADGHRCESGACSAGTTCLAADLTACPASSNRVACVDLTRGVPYCGSCTTVCGPDQLCVSGTCRSYSPATPCTTCPCAADCARVQGTPAVCCPGIAGGAQPICIHNASCP